MKYYYLLSILFLFSCGSDKGGGDKFPVGQKTAYNITTEVEGEMLSEMIPNSSVGIQFEVVNNNGEIATLAASDDNGQSVGTLEVNNEGFVPNEKDLESFINERQLNMHQIHYLFVPMSNPPAKDHEEWTHKQKLPSGIRLTDVDFEDTFIYRITGEEGDNHKIGMRAKVGAMSSLQDGDNVTGEYLVNKKTGLVENGNIHVQFMTGGVVHFIINKVD